MKDSTKVMGASNQTDKKRSAHDYYGTDPRATRALLDVETFSKNIWEPCAGHHKIADVLVEAGYNVRVSDLFEYEGYEHEIVDFLKTTEKCDGDIITNPPYNLVNEFILKCLDVVKPGHKVAMFLRLQTLEGQKRYEEIFKTQPMKKIYVFTNRQTCAEDDNFDAGSVVAYCWYIWEKGFTGSPELGWLTTDKSKKETKEVKFVQPDLFNEES